MPRTAFSWSAGRRWGDPLIAYELNGSGAVVAQTEGGVRTEHHFEGDRLEYDSVGGVASADYRYDADGNLEWIDRGADGGLVDVDYDYDEFGWMVHAIDGDRRRRGLRL